MPDKKEREITSMYNAKVRECDLLRSDNEILMKQVASLNRQIGGYKASNANYKKQVSERDRANSRQKNEFEKTINQLKESLDMFKHKDTMFEEFKARHDKELNDYKERSNEEFTKAMNEKQRTIESLSTQVRELLQKKCELESRCICNDDYIAELEKTIDELRTPWWKRIF